MKKSHRKEEVLQKNSFEPKERQPVRGPRTHQGGPCASMLLAVFYLLGVGTTLRNEQPKD